MALKNNKFLKNFNKDIEINAKNSDKSSDLFYKRTLYREMAFTSAPISSTPADLFPIRDFRKFENTLYGRVNMEFEPVVPKKIYIDPIGEGGNYALSFVAEAFSDLQKDIKRDVASGKIPDNVPFISSIKAHKSYDDINVGYNKWYTSSIRGDFLTYVQQFEDIKDIIDFDSFLKIFQNHFHMMASQSCDITFSSFCVGKKSNIRNSALVIEIADRDFSRDSHKIDFANSIYFSYYVKKAEKYGFFVDYNAPWRLVANLASPVMVRRGAYSGLHSFFSKYYEKAQSLDIKILKNAAFSIYSDFVSMYPTFKTRKLSLGGCVKEKFVIRQRLTRPQFDQNYTDKYWIKFYIDLKNAEKNLAFDRNELEKIKKRALEYKKYVDFNRSLGYINKVYQDIPSLEGSFYSLLNKQIYRDQAPLPFDNFDLYIKDIVRSYRKKTE